MNRHQRRALAKKMLPGGLQPIADAATKLQEALGAVQQVGNPKELERLVQEAHTTVSFLVEDVQKLANEQELLRNLLFARDPGLKEEFERLTMGAMVPSAAPCPKCVENGPCSHQ